MADFFRFPHTPHIAWLGKDSPRDDKVLSTLEGSRLLALHAGSLIDVAAPGSTMRSSSASCWCPAQDSGRRGTSGSPTVSIRG